ncbi:copper chaperone PCu(A)C [uncultured Sphingomonas sp.]|uniref:copper chaperone PCu(A)C n=1 Tax=uncultured Sphingomonas sp. TaxID=158754 RepID=UPI0035C9BE85
MRRLIPKSPRSLFVPALALLAIAGCSKAKDLSVDQAWVRLPAVPGQPAAAYFTLHGGPADATLIDVSTDVAIRSEMHETMRGMGGGAAGMTRMTPVPSVSVPARSTGRFAPGGRHVMFFGLDPSVKRGGAMTLTFTFGNGERIRQSAPVLGAGDPPPGE